MNGMLRRGAVCTGRLLLAAVVAIGTGVTARPAFAHHSRAMFDMTTNTTFQGVVQEYRWQNPHSHIVIAVAPGAADPSSVGTWVVEVSDTALMTAMGWTPTTYKPGDAITVVAHPNRRGAKIVCLFYAILPDGRRLYRATHRYEGEVE